MNLSGEHAFSAPQDVVWECLLAGEDIQAAIPGCERFVEVATDSYDITIKVGIASIKGTYSGHVEVADRNPTQSYRLLVRGSGRPGSVNGDALMTLSATPTGTLVAYNAEVRAEGAIARLGTRLLGGTAKLMVGQFMKAMEKQVQRRAAAAEAAP